MRSVTILLPLSTTLYFVPFSFPDSFFVFYFPLTLFFRIFPHNLQSEFKIPSVLHAKIMQDKARKQGL